MKAAIFGFRSKVGLRLFGACAAAESNWIYGCVIRDSVGFAVSSSTKLSAIAVSVSIGWGKHSQKLVICEISVKFCLCSYDSVALDGHWESQAMSLLAATKSTKHLCNFLESLRKSERRIVVEWFSAFLWEFGRSFSHSTPQSSLVVFQCHNAFTRYPLTP